jgi:hypothetical protein
MQYQVQITWSSTFTLNVTKTRMKRKYWWLYGDVLKFLISNFRSVVNVVCFFLGNSPASEFYTPTFRNTVCSIFIGRYLLAYEDGTNRVFRNVSIQNSDAGELPRRKHKTCTEMFEPYEDPVPLGCDSLSLCQEIPNLESNTSPLNVGIWLHTDTTSYPRRRLSTATPLQKCPYLCKSVTFRSSCGWQISVAKFFIVFELPGKSRFDYP